MSVALGPFTLTAGAITTVTEPAPGPTFAAVALYNLSALFVALNGGTEWLAPWTANLFPASTVGHPIQAKATGTAGVTGTLLATFFNPGEVPPNAVYPLALPATTVSAAPPPGTLTGRGFMFASAALQAIPNAAQTSLVMGTTVFDSDTGRVGNTYVVPTALAGIWRLRLQNTWLDSSAVGLRQSYIMGGPTGASFLVSATYPGYAAPGGQYLAWPAVEWEGRVAAGDVLIPQVQQTSGAPLNAGGGQDTNLPNFIGTYVGT